jgi:fibronectin-binding autotransporter adhesin
LICEASIVVSKSFHGVKGILSIAKQLGWLNAFRTLAVGAAVLGVAEVSGPARAGTLYWDTDGSVTSNNTSTGANMGGTGLWDAANLNWWDGSFDELQNWVDGSDAVFWGMPGAVTVSAVSASNVAFKTSAYTLNGGTLTMSGAPSTFNVDAGVSATINSTIAGTNRIWKVGTGTLVLANTNNLNTATTISGGWRIEGGGTLRLLGDGSLGAALPDSARNTVTDIEFNQSTIQLGGSFVVSQNRRTKINTNASTNRGDAIIDVNGHVLSWFGSLQGGAGSLRVASANGNGGMLILGTDKIASINPFGSVLPAGATNLTVQDGVVLQTSGQVTPTGGELGSETNSSGGVLTIKLDNGQIRSESGGYTFYRNLVLGPGGGSLDVGAWIQTFVGSAISGPGALTKWGRDVLVLDNSTATWAGGTRIREGTLQLGRNGSYGLLPGTLANPSSVVISAGATLQFSRGSDKSFFDIISGPGNVTIANSGNAVVRLVSDSTYTGRTLISSGMLMIGQGNPGDPGSIVSSVTNNGTLVFNRAEDLTYAGAISGPGPVRKVAGGKLVLIGTHTYTGETAVRGGTLIVNGVIGNSAVIVTNGTLGGNGVIQGPVTIQLAGRLSPGTSIGTLTISNSLTLSAVTVMELNAAVGTSDLIRGVTTLTYGGTLILSNLAGAISGSNTFKLFSANTYRGAFAALNPATPGPGLVWNTNTLATDGTLRVVSITPAPIAHSMAGNAFNVSWPGDHIGWRLQAQTNTLSTNWFNVANSIATNQMTFTIDPAFRAIFYRLVYP